MKRTAQMLRSNLMQYIAVNRTVQLQDATFLYGSYCCKIFTVTMKIQLDLIVSKKPFLSWYPHSTIVNYNLDASYRCSCLFRCQISILKSSYYPILNRRIVSIHGGCDSPHPRGSRICPSSSVSWFTAVTFYQRLSVMTEGNFSDTPRSPYQYLIPCSLCTPLRCSFGSSNNFPSGTSPGFDGVEAAVVDIVVDPLCRTCHR